jgi:serine/threonine-protein kinase RsbW
VTDTVPTPVVRLDLAARPESVVLARLAAAGIAARAGATDEEIADLKLAVSEICTNAVVHGHGTTGDSVVAVSYILEPSGMLTVEIVDSGGGFEPDVAETRPGEHRPLGLAISRAVTDELDVRSGPGGSRVVFSKHLGRQSSTS